VARKDCEAKKGNQSGLADSGGWVANSARSMLSGKSGSAGLIRRFLRATAMKSVMRLSIIRWD